MQKAPSLFGRELFYFERLYYHPLFRSTGHYLVYIINHFIFATYLQLYNTIPMQDKPLTQQESLDLIQGMIRSTQGNFSHDSFYYLFWGWLVLVASLANYLLLQLNISWANAVWILMPLGAIVNIIYSKRRSDSATVRTHLDRVIGFIWLSLAVPFLLILVSMNELGLYTYPLMMLLYGIGLFASGGAIKFRPLMLGGICCWALAVVANFMPFEQQLLCLAGAVLTGYIIPGHLLKAKFAHASV